MKRIEFQPPPGVVPEGATAGEDFDLVCSFRVKADGTVCLVEMGDVDMPGYDAKGESKPTYGEYAKSMTEPSEGA